MPSALIFGITGQTGSYLAELLLEKGYVVHGVLRRSSNFNTERIEHIFHKIRDNLHWGDILDSLFVAKVIGKIQPDEIYNLAAQSHVAVSFELPYYTCHVDSLGILNILEGVRMFQQLEKTVRIYQAGTSEMFGGDSGNYSDIEWEKIKMDGMNERTTFHPKSPYAAAKLQAHHLVKIYRESYGIFACNGILFNHESERRDPRFVTRKVTRTVAGIFLGTEKELVLGNLASRRDWGHAKDYARGIHLMLQHEDPLDLILCTGVEKSVRELVEIAFSCIGKTITWKGQGLQEQGCDELGNVLVRVSEKYYRPNEVSFLKGDATLARETLGWKPEIQFSDMIGTMVATDLDIRKKEISYQ
jgi:GDPmannose 4,6-dehydratase